MSLSQDSLSRKTRVLNGIRGFLRREPIERVLARMTTGRTQRSFLARIPANHYQYPPGTFRLVERRGVKYCLDLSDFLQWEIYYGLVDPAKERLFALVEEGDWVFDIGGLVGEVALTAVKLCGPQGRVYCFEPFPSSLERLRKNVSLNTFKNVVVVDQAVGGEIGEVNMSPPSGNLGGNRVVSGPGSATHVPVTTLDEFVEKLNLPRLDLVKIDTEGYEHNILRGAEKTIQEFRPKLFIELTDNFLRDYGSSARALVTFLEDRNYTVTHAVTGAPIRAEEDDFRDCHYDIVCLPAAR